MVVIRHTRVTSETLKVGGGVISAPPKGKKKIINLYYDPETGIPEFEVEG